MSRPGTSIIAFQLSALSGVLPVDVRLRRGDSDRWIAEARIQGASHLGLGPTARDALRAALSSFSDREVAALLADTALLAPSVLIAQAERPLAL